MADIKNETDYRNIPREMLDRNIPVGRGMVKWAPFATLPEQFETISQYMMDQNKIDRPVLSDDQLAQLNIRLHEALQKSQPINIKYYEEGYINFVKLSIYRIDSLNFEIEGVKPDTTSHQKISILDIVDITFA